MIPASGWEFIHGNAGEAQAALGRDRGITDTAFGLWGTNAIDSSPAGDVDGLWACSFSPSENLSDVW